jgi:hypothetical protein
MNEVKYEQDFYGWTQEQAQLLREGRFSELDATNVVEEIESLGRSERRELVSHMRVLLTHLLKWAYQPGRRGRSWRLTIEAQRVQVRRQLAENPSLQPQMEEVLTHAFELSVIDAERQTRLARRTFPKTCPWSVGQVMADDFWPGDA